MKLFTTTLLTLFLGLSALSSAKNSDSARSASLRHRAAIEHQERATLPEARFGLNRNKPIRGVNLGSWLITESWMMPKFYHDAQTSDQPLVDELSWIKAHSNRNDAYEKLKSHYTTYLTEADFQLMQSYGLNSVRVPIPYWTLEDAASSPDEAYLFKGGRPQMRQMLLWCKKYNLDVLLVLHAAPGSQNAYDNSGSRKGVFWQTKQSYYDRTITALETMTDFYVNNASYGGVVKAIIVMNEPLTTVNNPNQWIPLPLLKKFYIDAYRAIRSRVSAAKGAQNMPTIYFSNSIIGTDPWMGWIKAKYNDGTFIKGTIGFDLHRYQAFKPLDKLTYNQHITRTCESGKDLAAVQAVLPVVIGEMSDGVQLRCVDYRDCVGRTMQQDIDTLNSKASNYFARRFWEAQRVVYEQQAGGWFFWSWKSTSASQWSYRDSVQQVWLPSNPNERVFVPNTTEKADGQCVSRKSNHGINFRTGTS
ncbi:unnamed protein product [Tilletia controversa]|uniref:glucan 1,3-beta-glucosidase n=3 Tax=Tilletia TaxID=13289 RepID=A0A8X7STZ4_9BASI|nr:hypothetical protein CF328_g6532 [Tilletia controversa]KAE8191241.1 hypothetical protein CF336_g4957 [Tilletia laevis]KAE8258982.1 hypothetical protein A4X03_0g4228 [Tilletia caries]KAE8198046.1 hypothetical protein CF335_g4474 [Tilletia laevis]KAE8241780.1 hypothetical protein A4X06_0g7404 [Tilletia controversa]